MKKSVWFRASAFLVLPLAFGDVYASDLGNLGKRYAILEEDFVAYMQRTVNGQSEKADALNKKMRESGKRYLQRPPGVDIPRSEAYRYHEFDPTYTLAEDMFDESGVLLYPSGTQVNPLDYVSLRQSLCFFDGDDADQVTWVLSYCGKVSEAKLIMVDGPLAQIMEDYPQNRFFFDQKAILVNRFNIRALPSVVRQTGKLLVVEEFSLDE